MYSGQDPIGKNVLCINPGEAADGLYAIRFQDATFTVFASTEQDARDTFIRWCERYEQDKLIPVDERQGGRRLREHEILQLKLNPDQVETLRWLFKDVPEPESSSPQP